MSMAGTDPIVITGMGLICPLGDSLSGVWTRVQNGRDGMSRLNGVWNGAFSGLPVATVAPLQEETSRATRFALHAADDALRDAGWADTSCMTAQQKERVGICLGNSKGNVLALEKALRHAPDAGTLPQFFHDHAALAIARQWDLRGPCVSLISACSTGSHNIVQGARWILDGDADMVLAGAAESSLTPLLLGAFRRMGVLTQTACRPYAQGRDGFVLGEGAGVVMLERKSSALRRKAKIWAELAGWGLAGDAYKPVAFDPSGISIENAILRCAAQAGLEFSQWDYVNCHGTGTQENDAVESRVLRRLLAGKKQGPALSSTKPMTGHLLGAAGSVEFILTVLSLWHDYVPATLNLNQPDPACGLDFTPCRGRPKRIRHAMSLSYGFGGHVSALAIRKTEAA